MRSIPNLISLSRVVALAALLVAASSRATGLAGLLLLSAIEELAITRALPAWRANVSSLRGALRGIHPEGAGSFVDAWRNTT